MSSNKAPEKLYYCDMVKTPMLHHCGGDPHQVHTYIREDLAPKPDHIPDASKMVDELTGQPEFKNFKDQYAKAVIDREVKLVDWYNQGLKEALESNLKVAEEQRRREMFEKVALHMLASDNFRFNEIADTANEILRLADKFAKGDE